MGLVMATSKVAITQTSWVPVCLWKAMTVSALLFFFQIPLSFSGIKLWRKLPVLSAVLPQLVAGSV